jgi:hypothetical protein
MAMITALRDTILGAGGFEPEQVKSLVDQPIYDVVSVPLDGPVAPPTAMETSIMGNPICNG